MKEVIVVGQSQRPRQRHLQVDALGTGQLGTGLWTVPRRHGPEDRAVYLRHGDLAWPLDEVAEVQCFVTSSRSLAAPLLRVSTSGE